MFTLFTIAITVAEVAVGLAIVIVIFRVRRTGRGRPPRPPAGLSAMASARARAARPGRPVRRFLLLAAVRRCGAPAAAAAVGIAAIAGRWWPPAGRVSGDSPGGAARARRGSTTWSWLRRRRPMATVGVLVDALGHAMLLLVTLVSFLVQLYSLGYLHDEPRRRSAATTPTSRSSPSRCWAWSWRRPSSRCSSSGSWSGLCSYLLIGFWYERPAAARAAVKAFWITKLGDVGFVLGHRAAGSATGTFEFWTLFQMAGGHAAVGTLAL